MINSFLTNSEAAYEPLMGDLRWATLSSVEAQKSFMTPNSSLWRQKPPHVVHENTLLVSSQEDLNRGELSQSADLSPVNHAAIELLRSWRENDDKEDEEEQKATWEFLKEALDEDRLSYRKLFPEHEVTSDQIEDMSSENQTYPENEPSQSVILSPETQEFLQVLRSWREEGDEEDDEEQRTTWEYLKQALDEDRLSYRKLFPEHEVTSEQVKDINKEYQTYPENEPSQSVILSPETQEFLQVLRSWREEGDEEDDEEQRTTWEYLKQALDEDRLSYRKLFP